MIQDILEERGNRYGEFAEHARLAQELKDTLRSGSSWFECTDSQMEALDMISHKMARIVNGDPSYDDSWIDIVGYSQLVIDEFSDIDIEDEESIDHPDNNWTNLADFTSTLLSSTLDTDENTIEDLIDSVVDSISKTLDIPSEDTDNQSEAVDEPDVTTQDTDISEKLQLIQINGIKVFITGSELEKLEALKESEESTDDTPDDHENQTFMDFNPDDELTYAEFLRNQTSNN